MRKVRWGVLSTAGIGVKKVIPAMQLSEYCDMAAFASRNLGQAQVAAERLDQGNIRSNRPGTVTAVRMAHVPNVSNLVSAQIGNFFVHVRRLCD